MSKTLFLSPKVFHQDPTGISFPSKEHSRNCRPRHDPTEPMAPETSLLSLNLFLSPLSASFPLPQ